MIGFYSSEIGRERRTFLKVHKGALTPPPPPAHTHTLRPMAKFFAILSLKDTMGKVWPHPATGLDLPLNFHS